MATPTSSTLSKIRLLLAREPGHPAGDATHGYDIVAPLDRDGKLDASAWKDNREACKVRRFRHVSRSLAIASGLDGARARWRIRKERRRRRVIRRRRRRN